MKKIKALIFNPKISDNGINKILSDFIDNFDNNIDADILTFENINDIYFKNENLKIYEIGSTKNIFKRIRNEYKIISNGEYDVIHINGDYVSRVIECFVAKRAKVKKIIIHSHNDGIGNNRLLKVLFHKVLKKSFDFFATDYLACSNNAAKWMFSKKIIKNKKYIIINNGIDVGKFKFNNDIRNSIRKKYKIDNKFVVGFVGRLTYQKNPLFLIDLFNEIKEKNKNSFLIMIGAGELEQHVREKINTLNLTDSVLLLKNISNVSDYYNAIDCFVLPSRYEGLGIVNIEAQASGLPTIVSDRVPTEAKVSELIQFVSLNDSIEKWVDVILKKQSVDRNNAYKNVINYKYDILSSTKKIQKIYNT